MPSLSFSPPRPPPVKYDARHGTRWQKEKAAAGGSAFENPDDPKLIGPWVIGECVGKGASGRVKIAKHRRTGQLAAVKILPIQPILNSRASLATKQAKSDRKRLEIDREIIMMRLMNHPNIVRIYDVYETDKELFLILEYVDGGELFDFLVNRRTLPPLEALAFFKQIIYGINYAHTFSIIHRDLKPENIFIHSLDPPLIKIGDWGMATFAPPSFQLETCCGSPHYASPEIVNGGKYEGNATDIWSCGVILYVLLTGRLPFDGENVRSLLSKVSEGKYEMPSDIDPQAQDLLSRMLVVEASRRLTIPEILSHPWLQNATPGVIYVPAPPVSELAKPLPSVERIDRDLLESLRVIWGRRADLDVIRADLLSPEGEGTLAKAFYFLLNEYREKTLEEYSFLIDIDKSSLTPRLNGEYCDKLIARPYIAPPSSPCSGRLAVEHQTCGRFHSSRDAPAPPSRSPSPLAMSRVSSLAPPSPVETHSRPRPPSPLGPRPPKPRPQSTPVTTSPTNSLHSYIRPGHCMSPINSKFSPSRLELPRSLSPSPQPYPTCSASPTGHSSKQRPTYTHQGPFIESPPKISTVRFPATSPPPQYHSKSPPPVLRERRTHNPSSMVPPGVHLPHVSVPMTPRVAIPGNLPMLAAPRTDNAEFQRAIDNITERVNVLVARGNAEKVPQPSRPGFKPFAVNENGQTQSTWIPHTHRHPYPYQTSLPVYSPPDGHSGIDSADKENQVGDWVGYSFAEPVQKLEGLGINKPYSGRIGHPAADGDTGDDIPLKGRREKRSRPPTLNFHHPPLNTKRSAVSVLSPTPLASPSALLSPVVGEFKGWFSNLFNWKAQTYVLYSPEDLFSTRNETIRLLHQFGASVGLEESVGHTVLRCRIDDYIDPINGSVIQKRTCFRVEFASSLGENYGHGGLSSPQPYHYGEPYVPQNGHSPHLNPNSMKPGMLGKNMLMKMPGYLSAIVLVQEKGSLSTFRALCKKLKGDWRLNSGLQTPGVGTGGTHTPLMEYASKFAV